MIFVALKKAKQNRQQKRRSRFVFECWL